MPRRVKGPNGVVQVFPDDATDAEIASALETSNPSEPAAPSKTDSSMLSRAAAWLPEAGGAIGGMAGGVPGAAVGGAAGQGYEALLTHLTELPTVLKDVARLALEQPTATAKGFLQGATRGAVNAGEAAAVQGGAQAVGAGLGAVASKVAPALMQSALKPGLKTSLAAVKKGSEIPAVKTLLEEGVNVTPGGIEKLNAIISASNETIADALNSLPSAARVSPLKAAGRLTQTAAKFAHQVNPASDLEAVSRAGQEFLDHPSLTSATMSVPEAQAMKTGTYAQLKAKAYGELKGADIEAQKAIARGLKEEIASEAQKYGIDITAANAREGAAITARE